MKSYKLKSSAARAAKKEMGENWEEFALIAPQGDEFVIELKSTKAIALTPIVIAPDFKQELEVTALIAQNEEEIALKASKKAEIGKKKPFHIPSTPAKSIVKEEMAPTSKPSLPAFLKIVPPKEEGVPTDAQINDALLDQGDISPEAHQKEADRLANLAAVNVDPIRPRLSSCELPTKKVWHIADSMPNAKRKEVIEECVRQGIAYGTARTQYQHWFKTTNDSKAAPIAVIGKDGKITIPGKE